MTARTAGGRRARAPTITLFLATTAALLLIAGACRSDEEQARRITGGEPRRGREAIALHGCGTCHVIPGVHGADGYVGPPLTGVAKRVYLAGRLVNTPENMARWIQHPQAIVPGNAMPEMGISDQDARDITAYLYTLR